jgi:mRNA interferase RelE/StbE
MSKKRVYEIKFEKQALRDLENAPPEMAKRAMKKIIALADEPRPDGCKKLVDRENAYRIRVGDWRVIYRI